MHKEHVKHMLTAFSSNQSGCHCHTNVCHCFVFQHYGAVGRVGDSEITVRPRTTNGKPTVEIRIHRDDKDQGKLSYKINYVDE